MTKKSKALISIISICAVLCVCVITVVAVFAAKQHNFSSSIVVNYNSKGIDGTASATLHYANTSSSFTDDGTKTGRKTLTFKKDDKNFNSILKPTQKFYLEKPNNYVVFEYVFSCSSTTEGYTAELNFAGIAENVRVTTLLTSSKQTNFSSLSGETAVGDANNFSLTANVPQGRMYYVYIKAAVIDTEQDANFSANFSWTLRS